MDNKNIRRNLYRVLRKTGIPRDRIAEDATFSCDLMMDETDMTCFLYYLETRFNLEIDNENLPKIKSINSTINYLKQQYA
ncbi:acyl carrier protein [Marinilabiliaceae bacterium ANBcel2]|nr:acyl carrier protein [Marinilabiliaceae bacterium ANBcel2]